MEHTKGEWKNGNIIGITGPTTPTTNPTVAESVEYYDWEENGAEGEPPQTQHTIITVGTQTIAIIPTSILGGVANARLISAAPDLLAACLKAAPFVALCIDTNSMAGIVLEQLNTAVQKAKEYND